MGRIALLTLEERDSKVAVTRDEAEQSQPGADKEDGAMTKSDAHPPGE